MNQDGYICVCENFSQNLITRFKRKLWVWSSGRLLDVWLLLLVFFVPLVPFHCCAISYDLMKVSLVVQYSHTSLERSQVTHQQHKTSSMDSVPRSGCVTTTFVQLMSSENVWCMYDNLRRSEIYFVKKTIFCKSRFGFEDKHKGTDIWELFFFIFFGTVVGWRDAVAFDDGKPSSFSCAGVATLFRCCCFVSLLLFCRRRSSLEAEEL